MISGKTPVTSDGGKKELNERYLFQQHSLGCKKNISHLSNTTQLNISHVTRVTNKVSSGLGLPSFISNSSVN